MTAPNHRANPRHAPWLILAIVSLPVFIGALDLTIISAVLPEVIVSLDLPVKEYLDQASWAVNGYLIAYALSMTFTGRLSDLLGRRTIYLACLLIFMVGSYFVTLYDQPALLEGIERFYYDVLGRVPPRTAELRLYLVIAGRVVQALGAGAMVPVTIALAGDLFPPEKRAKPIGVIGAVDTLGWVLGHLYGGVMVHFFGLHGEKIVEAAAQLGLHIATPSWKTLFLLNIPVSALAWLGAWWVLRGIAPPRAHGRFDWLGTLLIAVVLVGLNVGLGANAEGTGSATNFQDLQRSSVRGQVYFLLAAGVAFGLFLWVEKRARSPLIRLGMFRGRNFATASLTNLLVGYCLAIGLVSAPLLVNFRAETLSAEDIRAAAYTAGLLLSGLTVPMALAAIPGGWLGERYGYRLPTVLGLGLACLGFVSAGLVWRSDTPYRLMAAQMGVIGVGLGLTISPISTAALNDVSSDERGSASALVLILRLVGMTLALSSLTFYSLERFDAIRPRYLAETTENAYDVIVATQHANLLAAIDVIDEMQFIGAAVSLVALLVALRLRGGQRRKPTL